MAGPVDFISLAGIVVVLVGTSMARAKVGRGPFAGFVLFLLTLLPIFALRTDLDQYTHVADHLAYLAGMVVIVAVVVACAAAMPQLGSSTRTWLTASVVGIVAISLVVLAELRFPDYRTAENAWTAALRRDPTSAIANNKLGLI